MDRREFIQTGIAVSALPIVGGMPAVSALAEPAPVPLYKVVFDSRFADSVAFGAEARRLGLPVHAIAGDMTDLWFNDLDQRWRKGPAAIAGLTAHGPLFCLERLAWEHGMRVSYRAEHFRDGHRISGPEALVARAGALSDSGSAWARDVAGLVARHPASWSGTTETALGTPARGLIADGTEPLISWVIAPVRRA